MIDFTRYLTAKKTVDDRAINQLVWSCLVEELTQLKIEPPLRVLELGCGIGTMVERLIEWGLADRVDYIGIDSNRESIRTAVENVGEWGINKGFEVHSTNDGLELQSNSLNWTVNFINKDFRTYQTPPGMFHLLIANAFLDLIDIQDELPKLAELSSPDGLFYFTINFDGCTIFEPVSDPSSETQIINLYHESMDMRKVGGKPSGDSCSGRHVLHHLRTIGACILSAGASDWVVYPGENGYPDDEEYFLNCIIDFFEGEMVVHPDVDQTMVHKWLGEKRELIKSSELIFIAHQLDFLGKFQ